MIGVLTKWLCSNKFLLGWQNILTAGYYKTSSKKSIKIFPKQHQRELLNTSPKLNKSNQACL
jgi:hypothetical protein